MQALAFGILALGAGLAGSQQVILIKVGEGAGLRAPGWAAASAL